MKEHLKENLEWLTEKALDDVDDTLNESVTLTKREMLIKWRRYNKFLLECPQLLIKSFESGELIEQPTEFDPYMQEKDFEKK